MCTQKIKPVQKRGNKVKLRGTKKKCRRKLKKEFSSDESVSLEQSGPESESEEFFGEMLQTIENENKDEEELVNIIEGNIKPGVWVLVEGKGKFIKKHWIGQVLSIDPKTDDPTIKFLKKQEKCEGNKPYFIWCTAEGCIVDQGYVVKVLPEPNFTPRGWLLFPVSFGDEYNIQ